ncbi:recombinase family protein [Methylobacterium sp. Leaf456]|uniref:recombinase family protein n=1 Tax=Methylobacterium sp. Leaf456 TaxID=1736382 RepID=UPI000A858500|nr:recombinase family protein [Methylobacterium sp. Leaf456]
MIRVALYAQYSSDNQRETSIEDQLRICQERANKEGWTITEAYTDYAISGTSMHRAGVKSLLRDAISGKFDIILSEALDRLSRDQEDVAGFYKRTQFAGVKIITLAEGEITSLHIGFKGTMKALFLKDMADKVRRGQRGRVEKGKAGGDIAYGYDVVRKLDEHGELIRGDRTINAAQAAIVRRIFAEYAKGRSPKIIAQRLNKEDVAGPSGAGWTASTINGNWQRGSGILNNELYQGVIAWNEVHYIKIQISGNMSHATILQKSGYARRCRSSGSSIRMSGTV